VRYEVYGFIEQRNIRVVLYLFLP